MFFPAWLVRYRKKAGIEKKAAAQVFRYLIEISVR